jgi:dipeptidyl aminopeptidase/acylaminoacyl peptidase
MKKSTIIDSLIPVSSTDLALSQFAETSRRVYWLRLLGFTLAISAVAAIFLVVHFVQLQLQAFLTPQRQPEVGTPAELKRPYQDISLTTSDGLKIAAWYISGERPQAIILVHGIDANRNAVMPEAKILGEAGFHLLMLDLRAHGQSEGHMGTYGYQETLDVQAAVDYLDALPQIEQIGAVGTSYGGAAVARAAAADLRLKAIVIESSYSSLTEAVEDAFDDRSIFPGWSAPWLIALAEQRAGLKISEVDSARDLATLSPRAVMIIHGIEDHLFPVEHARRMYAAAQAPKALWLIEGLGHANPVIGREGEYREQVVSFFEQAFSQ